MKQIQNEIMECFHHFDVRINYIIQAIQLKNLHIIIMTLRWRYLC